MSKSYFYNSFDAPRLNLKVIKDEKEKELLDTQKKLKELEEKLNIAQQDGFQQGFKKAKDESINYIEQKTTSLQDYNKQQIQNILNQLQQSKTQLQTHYETFVLEILKRSMPIVKEVSFYESLKEKITAFFNGIDQRHIKIQANEITLSYLKDITENNNFITTYINNNFEDHKLELEWHGGGMNVNFAAVMNEINQILTNNLKNDADIKKLITESYAEQEKVKTETIKKVRKPPLLKANE